MPNYQTDSNFAKKSGDNMNVRDNSHVTPGGSRRVTYFEIPTPNT